MGGNETDTKNLVHRIFECIESRGDETGLTTAEMQNSAHFEGWDFNATWTFLSGKR